MSEIYNRRPIAARSAWWANKTASFLLSRGWRPNQISVLSIAFAVVGGSTLLIASSLPTVFQALCLVFASCCILLRLFCNLLDGLMAVEGGFHSKLGVLYNEFPDRIADTLFLICAGYASQAGEIGIVLGWAAALVAALTAYVRSFGGAQNLKQDFCGPMAKQQRMVILTVASLCASIESICGLKPQSLMLALIIITVGAVFTCFRRINRLAVALEHKIS